MITPELDDPAAMRVLCLAGSLRRGSWNRLLLKAAVHAIPRGMRAILYEELDAVPMFNEDCEQSTAAAVEHLRGAVAAADGMLIATAEYNHSIPGVLKNAIDWLSRGSNSVLVGKPIAVIGASSGKWGTRLAQAALRQVLTATEALVMPAPMLFLARAGECFGDDGKLCEPEAARSLSLVIASLKEWILLHRQSVPAA